MLPKQTRRNHREVTRPVYFGLRGTRSESGKILVDEPYFVDLNELTRHVLISGSTGVGKTRVAQIIAESSALNLPTVIIDLLGDFTGMIQENPQASKERQFKLPNGRSYSPVIYTLDDTGIKFGTNLLRKPNVSGEFLIPCADEVATILSDLIGDLRFRDTFREIIVNEWRNDQQLNFDTFLEKTRTAAREKRTSIKLDRLAQFRILISKESFQCRRDSVGQADHI